MSVAKRTVKKINEASKDILVWSRNNRGYGEEATSDKYRYEVSNCLYTGCQANVFDSTYHKIRTEKFIYGPIDKATKDAKKWCEMYDKNH